MDRLLVFCGVMGTTLQEKHKKHIVGTEWGGGLGGVLSEVPKKKWGNVGGNGGGVKMGGSG